MRHSIFFIFALLIASPSFAQEANNGFFESVAVEGGPIWSQHFQSGDSDYREHHGLAIVKASTKDYGNWGIYYLSPNSVDRTSFGAGYVTDPYTVPLGPTKLELTGGLGIVTGYQDYPLPLVVGQARLVLVEREKWDAGVAMAVLPFVMKDDRNGDSEFGIVGTTPFLSLRYKFN